MASGGTLPYSTPVTHHLPSSNGSVTTNGGVKGLQPFGFRFKCTLAACTVGGIAGVVIVILGTLKLFGPIGSIGFVASITSGATAVVIAICVIGMAVLNGKSIVARQETDARRRQNRVARQEGDEHYRYSELGIQAIDFALQKLDEHPEVKPKGWDSIHRPVNPDIARLTTLLWKVYGKAFRQGVEKYPENPWIHEEVIQAADACMKISYAISCLTLEDLPAFTQKLPQEDSGKTRSYRKALIKQDSYLCSTFFYCSNVYCWMTGEQGWSVFPEYGQLYPEATVVKDHAERFYQEGTIEFVWRTLYNDYCTRVRLYRGDKPLRDGRHEAAIEKDKGIEVLIKRLEAHLSYRC